MNILVITTGGTIGAMPYPDPIHPPRDCHFPPPGSDFVRDVLEGPLASYGARCLTMEPRDSKFIDGNYRWNLVEHIAQARENAVVIAHGTDALLDTNDFLFCQRAFGEMLADKTILTVGAMTPLANGPGFDALPNLRFALDAAEEGGEKLPPLASVLSGPKKNGEWGPMLYPHRPHTYYKKRGNDGTRYYFALLPTASAA